MGTAADTGHRTVRVLIAEDSPTQATKLEYTLESRGYEVTCVHNGREALASIHKQQPDLLLTDIVMPDMDGYELCRHIRHDKERADTPVILLTALSEPADIVRGLECGADDFITKPYSEDHLLDHIERWIAGSAPRRREATDSLEDVSFAGEQFRISSNPQRILNLLLTVYERTLQQNHDLASAARQLEALNEDLAARTADLSAVNRELEAFAYSASHDLQAPLRAIDGFARMLMEDHADTLGGDGRHQLEVIEENARRMAQLIDDLLAFSRLGREELSKSQIAMTALAEEVFEQLQLAYPGRVIQLSVGPLPPASGDLAMVREVFANLLSNAIKYTAPRAEAVIEVGARTEGHENIYYVRDNGVGFDMAYADKLFCVFQRLHSDREFEGTGIGLALVQRVIHRHGGRVWAEGQENEGATFYFTLPTEQE